MEFPLPTDPWHQTQQWYFGFDSKGNKSKNKQVELLKLKNSTAKETINKMKRQPIEWDEVFANKIFDKGLISKNT